MSHICPVLHKPFHQAAIETVDERGAINALLQSHPSYSFSRVDGLDHFLLKAESKRKSVELFRSGLRDAKLEIHPEYISTVAATLKGWLARL